MKAMTKMVGGAVAGVALGVAASMFLSSKKGKALTSNIKETVADFYKNISPQLKKIGDMGQQEYKEFMGVAVEKYAKAKNHSTQTAKELRSQVQKSWQHFAQNME
mgnify:CR=1 FL=1